MDGKGLIRMVAKHRLRGLPLLGLPLAGAVRGILLALVEAPAPLGALLPLLRRGQLRRDAEGPRRVSRPASAAALLRDVRWPTTARRARAGGRTLPMAQNSVALILAKVATMGLGFLFWLVAARLFAPADVGLASGAVSAMMLITQLALLRGGLGRHLALPGAARTTRRRCSTAR